MSVSNEAVQEKKAAAMRELLLNAAFELLVEHPAEVFSHEAIARAAGVGARTVYRYFPAQSDLYEALWRRLREQSGTIFPATEEEIVPMLASLYRAFDQNSTLVRAVMESAAGSRVRAQGAAESRASFEQSLGELLRGRSPVERRKARAVFQSMHSAGFWQMLQDRGELTSTEAGEAACWAAQTLLDALRREQRKAQSGSNDRKKRGV